MKETCPNCKSNFAAKDKKILTKIVFLLKNNALLVKHGFVRIKHSRL
ncbi:hypothetical protein PSEHALCIP103_00930 [Pseudoalteromonas haloplanktis]|uniref:Uncharacterized protein n=1 Tax=Pseudoalteromonas haloplanktis TaxID=228 RepID=A0A9W4QUZ9_PSEHA|nr:hypothetical protein PSEHALCIP103_00930 [Pseudoalteromonas haloplanktis]